MVAPATGAPYLPPVQEAQSLVQVLKRVSKAGAFLAEIVCTSGVTHQVRVHMASRGFPLVGDRLYDPEFSRRFYQKTPHLLRAMEIQSDQGTWRLDGKSFESLGEFFVPTP